VKIIKYPIIGPYTPLRTPRRTCRYLSGPEILEVRNYLPQYNVIYHEGKDCETHLAQFQCYHCQFLFWFNLQSEAFWTTSSLYLTANRSKSMYHRQLETSQYKLALALIDTLLTKLKQMTRWSLLKYTSLRVVYIAESGIWLMWRFISSFLILFS
jgi:hypothetical protein